MLTLLSVAALAVCTYETDVIIGTGFIKLLNSTSSGDCCNKCAADISCVAFTFDTTNGNCFLKDNMGAKTNATDRVSGLSGNKGLWNACMQANSTAYPFCDTKLSLDARLNDLVSRVQLSESGFQLTARESPAIDRLGLPSYYWGTNAIHGVQDVTCVGNLCPTAFPSPVSMASAFNTSIVKDMGQVIGTELRAYFNSQNHNSLNTWSPTININRDPRWGRNVESPGEDPLVCGSFGSAYLEGLQYGEDDTIMKATVTIKHWVAYSVENFNGVTRHNFDANVSAYDFTNTYLPAFSQVIGNGAKGVMCSYNMVNGRPTCGNPALTDILKGWGFDGYITSDTDSCADIWQTHHYAPDQAHATAVCLKSGTDIDSGNTYNEGIPKAMSQGLITQEDVNKALYDSYRSRFQMGMFDANVTSPYKQIPLEKIGCAEHQALSLETSRQSQVLLKNNGLLPLAKGKTVAVIGTSSNTAEDILGNYNGPLCPSGGFGCIPTIYDMVKKVGGGATTVLDQKSWSSSLINQAVEAAKAADYVVLVASNALDGGGEGHDRYTIALEATQKSMCDAVLQVAADKTVLLLINGGIIAIDDLKNTSKAILESFMPGATGAQAVAETIFGDNVPGGKMPVTMYHSSYINEVNFLNMSMEAGPGRSYRYYKGTPLYPFGYGLSYTTFDLQWVAQPTPAVLTSKDAVSMMTCKVMNTGSVAGAEVVFLYTSAPGENRRLVAWEKVHLAPGQSSEITFKVPATALYTVTSQGVQNLETTSRTLTLSRGHGTEITASLAVQVPFPQVLFAFEPWW
eukprot:TRINITY_DN17324_c0_g1_i1.p1 TRINITY_DN17324_c0_g1~~TRINITY_DN17324_c0_g1_i1.p1  ORF type:complete len:807 (+),score=213.88 TRINITY_DN17324_c0_g1_i1:31-2421(+)